MENNEETRRRKYLLRTVAGIFAILLLQGVFVHSLHWGTIQQSTFLPDFRSFPASLETWTLVNDDPIPKFILDRLQPDDYVHRTYLDEGTRSAKNAAITSDVFIGYFKSAESANRPHSPADCLPGSGWIPITSEITQLTGSGEDSISLTRMVLRKESQTIFVLFWYQNARQTWARESIARLQMIPEILRHQRSELAIVRIATAIDSGLDAVAAEKMDRLSVLIRRSLADTLKAPRAPRSPIAAIQ